MLQRRAFHKEKSFICTEKFITSQLINVTQHPSSSLSIFVTLFSGKLTEYKSYSSHFLRVFHLNVTFLLLRLFPRLFRFVSNIYSYRSILNKRIAIACVLCKISLLHGHATSATLLLMNSRTFWLQICKWLTLMTCCRHSHGLKVCFVLIYLIYSVPFTPIPFDVTIDIHFQSNHV